MNTRYSPLMIGLLIGVALGLLYGWVIHPVERNLPTPTSLQEKHQADLILLIGEAYSSDGDLSLATQRLNRLGFTANKEIIESALNFAQAHDFSDQDVKVLKQLLDLFTIPASTTEISSP